MHSHNGLMMMKCLWGRVSGNLNNLSQNLFRVLMLARKKLDRGTPRGSAHQTRQNDYSTTPGAPKQRRCTLKRQGFKAKWRLTWRFLDHQPDIGSLSGQVKLEH